MALSFDTTIGAGGLIIAEANADSAATASFSTAANVRLVACVACNVSPGAPTLSVSGAGLSWAQEVSVLRGSAIRAEIWIAYSSSALSSQTVTATKGASDNGISMALVGLLGAEETHGGAENTANSASGTAECSITTNKAGSYIFSTMGDWAEVGDPGVGTDPAETKLNGHHISTLYSAGQSRTTNTVSVGTYTMDFTGASRNYAMAVIEIREAADEWTPETDADETLRVLSGRRW